MYCDTATGHDLLFMTPRSLVDGKTLRRKKYPTYSV